MNIKTVAMIIGIWFLYGCVATTQTAQDDSRRLTETDTHMAILSINPFADLVNTYWKVVSIYDAPVAMGSSQMREAFLKLMRKDRKITGFSGCNNYKGTYEFAGNTLRFGPVAMTRKVCLNGMETETNLMRVLANTAYYSIHEHRLKLYDQQRNVIATLDAIYF